MAGDMFECIRSSRTRLFFALFTLLALAAYLTVDRVALMHRERYEREAIAKDSIDERMTALYRQLNEFPSGAGNDLLFLAKALETRGFRFGTAPGPDPLADLSAFFRERGAYDDLFFIDPDGQEEFSIHYADGSTELVRSDESHEQDEYFKRALEIGEGEVYISDITTGQDGTEPRMFYATPVYGGENVRGVLVLSVDVSYFLDDVRNYARTGERAYLVGERGNYIAAADRSKERITGGEGDFARDFPAVADVVLSGSGERYAEDASHVFVFRPVRPTLSSFVLYKGANSVSGARSDFFWVLVSVSDKVSVAGGAESLARARMLSLALSLALIALAALLVASLLPRRGKDTRPEEPHIA